MPPSMIVAMSTNLTGRIRKYAQTTYHHHQKHNFNSIPSRRVFFNHHQHKSRSRPHPNAKALRLGSHTSTQ
eukprot:c43445_g1_i1 orf=3-212(-)